MSESKGEETPEQYEPGKNVNDDATSKETLEDVEETEKVSSSDPKPDPGPSPDGSVDERDEIKDAGPM